MSNAPRRFDIEILETLDAFRARACVKTLAASIGFGARELAELMIVVSELATNIVKYGVRGSIQLEIVEDAREGVGLSIVARDIGPPFRDPVVALRDGCDDHGPIDPAALLRRGGIGGGLGAVVRFTDTFRIEPEALGKRLCAVRYRTRSARR